MNGLKKLSLKIACFRVCKIRWMDDLRANSLFHWVFKLLAHKQKANEQHSPAQEMSAHNSRHHQRCSGITFIAAS